MLRVSQVNQSIDEPMERLHQRICKKLRIRERDLIRFSIYRESVDARRRPIRFSYVVDCEVADEQQVLRHAGTDVTVVRERPFVLPAAGSERLSHRPVVVGFGPGGMFAALMLARAGYRPLVLERGQCLEQRVQSVQRYWQGGALDPRGNVQFGEGGAGTFSDGKLTTRSKDPRCHQVLRELVHFGAPKEILYQAHPHIGTDILVDVVRALREEVIALGGEIRFVSQVEDLIVEGDALRGVVVNGARIDCEKAILAIGHSARDTFSLLYEHQLQMQAKAFAVGVRVEHAQRLIDEQLYGEYAGHPRLGAASYRMTCRADNGRGVYTFCMCPGGFVVPAASGPEQIVVNGMSPSNRGSVWANSGMVVELQPEDFGARFSMFGVLAGIKFQEDLERQCYLNGNCKQTAPAQRMTDFVNRRNSFDLPRSSYSPGLIASPLHFWLPDFIVSRLQEGFKYFGNVSHGFLTREAVMIGVETRTSSPVRIPRDRESMTHIRLRGFYPCGEGAGYAGGIVSAAIDGERCAEALAMQIKQSSSFDRSV